MDKKEYIHRYATQLFNDRNKDSGSNENVHFYIGDITEAMWQAWDASFFFTMEKRTSFTPSKRTMRERHAGRRKIHQFLHYVRRHMGLQCKANRMERNKTADIIP